MRNININIIKDEEDLRYKVPVEFLKRIFYLNDKQIIEILSNVYCISLPENLDKKNIIKLFVGINGFENEKKFIIETINNKIKEDSNERYESLSKYEKIEYDIKNLFVESDIEENGGIDLIIENMILGKVINLRNKKNGFVFDVYYKKDTFHFNENSYKRW